MRKSLYDYLEVNPAVAPGILKAAYGAQLQRYDPDTNPAFRDEAANMLKIVRHAYSVLSDPEQRRRYDEKLGRQAEDNCRDDAVERAPRASGAGIGTGATNQSKPASRHDSDLSVEYAGCWRRFLACCIDAFVICLPLLFIDRLLFGEDVLNVRTGAHWGVLLLNTGLGLVYIAAMLSGPRHATLGRQMLGIEVRSAGSLDGISFWRPIGRTLASSLSFLLFYVGYLMQPFTAKRQTLHDMMAGTVVVVARKVGTTSRVLVGVLGFVLVAAIGAALYAGYIGRTTDERQYASVVSQMERQHPELDPDSPRYDQRVVDEAQNRMAEYVKHGMTPTEALWRAVADMEK